MLQFINLSIRVLSFNEMLIQQSTDLGDMCYFVQDDSAARKLIVNLG